MKRCPFSFFFFLPSGKFKLKQQLDIIKCPLQTQKFKKKRKKIKDVKEQELLNIAGGSANWHKFTTSENSLAFPNARLIFLQP